MQSRAATVDRLLQSERRKQQLRQRAHSKPGTLLKHQIPIRTFAEWNEAEPGFAEIEERFGSRVKKSYHAPQTPYQRVLACAEVSAADKKELQRQYRLLNPAGSQTRA